MPLSLENIASNTASVTFPYAGDTITIVYYPERITDKMLHAISAMRDQNDVDGMLGKLGGFNETLASLIQSWDLYEDAAQTTMIPIEAKRFESLSIPFKKDVFLAIAQDLKSPN
jgi:hypothetical protein